MPSIFFRLGLCALLTGGLATPRADAQLAYSGPTGSVLMQKARQQQAAGDRAGAVATFQRAYLAYTSVDDSDGMTAALAGKKAAESGAGAASAARSVAAARPAVAGKAAPAPAGAAPLAGRMEGNKPVGLFFVTKSVLGNFFTLSYYFAPNGMAYENPPGLSAAELAATRASNKGRYSVSGSTLIIAWTGSPKPESAEMHPLKGGFSWSLGSIFSAVGPFRGPAQLVGSFEGGSSTYTPMGGAVVSKSLTFRPDGTYSSGGVATVTSVTERSVAETGGSSQAGGRWKLDGWFLTLTDAQGRSVRDIAYPVGTAAKVDLFNFNGTAYSRH
ncbi:hypothetical protein [Hymenobacter ruricola]|uniref:Tetratricopeptide repeat protein n=1 Tax=Hymenobacter ruricola TaxID=2791023 RepID=A0ABS0I7D0_9BACT|nr:hypothetical protein [Hymenobacter ruricola]MBF9222419.1 hypothetical protein [Hymenobacter ruricola]